MKIIFNIKDRFSKSILIYDSKGNIVSSLEDSGDLFLMLTSLFPKNEIKKTIISDIEVKVNGKSLTSEKIAYSLANALLYSLKLKSLIELKYPERPLVFF